ncbi:hypothetical protein [Brevibacillus massiliensis]|uniref:hypothetical protein n=1 Tax=Brevibacillus massiliensis TaxID=1118054 RepID=UPI00030450F6|nr:hypothetical protein [Brevibacillus massiliensis]
MRKRVLIFMLCLVLAGSGLAGTGLAASLGQQPIPLPDGYQKFNLPNNSYLLESKRIDVTGDGKPDLVSLIGKKDSSSVYWEKLFVAVENEAGHPLSASSGGGSNPRLTFCGFTGRKAADILVSAETGGSGGTSDYYLYAVAEDKLVSMPVPPPVQVTGNLQDNYAAKLTLENTQQTYEIDLHDRKPYYDQLHMYKAGKLVQPISLMANAYSELKPMPDEPTAGCDLQGIQRVSGVVNADTIAHVVSHWRWDPAENKWKLAKATLKIRQHPI